MQEKENILIVKAQKGDLEAFGELVSLYQKRVYSIAYHIAHNHEDAEDVAQEVFIRLHEKIHKFRWRSSFFTWLYRITMNVCRNYLRRKRVACEPFEETVIDRYLTLKRENPAKELVSTERNEVITKAIDMLPYQHRTVVILHDIEGYSHKDISEIMGCSEGTVWSRLFYARRSLRKKLTGFLSLEGGA